MNWHIDNEIEERKRKRQLNSEEDNIINEREGEV